MTYTELEGELRRLRVTPPDTNRASLYLDYLSMAQTFFQTTLATNLGAANYSFVRTAVRSANLMNAMAELLDLYIGPAVDEALNTNVPQNQTYQQYFDTNILGNNYVNNRNTFRATYTVSTGALQLLYNHFTNNIEQACRRVYTDKAALNTFFDALTPGTSNVVQELIYIKSTGSDFHKGGTQVLIFTLNVDVVKVFDINPLAEVKRLVYKPSDIEADCLLAGRADIINAVTPGFMTASLFEIYNTQLAAYKLAHPAFTGLPLPTYGILPRVYQSTPHVQLRNTYGYIEFLNNDLTGTTIQFNGYFPFAQSDYLIFNSQNAAAIIRTFYRIEGAICAIACSFSMQDLHLENLRVKQYLPYLIDMEISLNKATNNIGNTSLIAGGQAPIGGINGLYLDAQDFHWSTPPAAATGSNCYLQQIFEVVYKENRLWNWASLRNKQYVPVNQPELLTGFADGMEILRYAQQNNAFTAWFARLKNNVVVRYIPYATAIFRNTFITPYYFNPSNATGNLYTMPMLVRGMLTTEAHAYQIPDNPNFLVLAGQQCVDDLTNLDVPIYYYRIGMQEILDSEGAQVAIPASVTINDNNNPPNPIQFTVALGRTTFFPNVPTTAIIEQQQVQVLGGAGYAARVLQLQNSITTALQPEDLTLHNAIPVN
ncbi:glycoside hydrolase family protein [Chitinophaga deserti]|uniref:DUF4135 domain-containing protein n=1 Tax=Chitinophaga deserti TaxID=2164099 RepID=UPI000D6BB3C4|nr:DUF4135 domain-containing protein [Chitinophaga deserti]